jgi:hypothetical protein
MSHAARLTLLKSCLASIPVYLMLVIKFLKWAIEAINSQIGNFIWNGQENKHNYHLANWKSLAQKKELGGIWAPNLRDINLCLLASWIQRYQDSDNKLWKEIVDNKYHTSEPNVLCCKDRQPPPSGKV